MSTCVLVSLSSLEYCMLENDISVSTIDPDSHHMLSSPFAPVDGAGCMFRPLRSNLVPLLLSLTCREPHETAFAQPTCTRTIATTIKMTQNTLSVANLAMTICPAAWSVHLTLTMTICPAASSVHGQNACSINDH